MCWIFVYKPGLVNKNVYVVILRAANQRLNTPTVEAEVVRLSYLALSKIMLQIVSSRALFLACPFHAFFVYSSTSCCSAWKGKARSRVFRFCVGAQGG